MALISAVALLPSRIQKFENIADKAISVGESNQVNVINCSIEKVAFGVVSKDSSKTVVASGTAIKNAKTAAFSCFQKKNSLAQHPLK